MGTLAATGEATGPCPRCNVDIVVGHPHMCPTKVLVGQYYPHQIDKTGLPIWRYCRDKEAAVRLDKEDELTPLEQFILDNEPAVGAEEDWRKALAAVVRQVQKEWK